MSGVIYPLPKYAFVAWYLVKHRDNFTFTFLPNIIREIKLRSIKWDKYVARIGVMTDSYKHFIRQNLKGRDHL